MPDPHCMAAIAAGSTKWAWVPFVGVGATGALSIDTKALATTLSQAAIIAGVVLYSNSRVMEVRIKDIEAASSQRIEQLTRQVEALQIEIRAMRADLYRPVGHKGVPFGD